MCVICTNVYFVCNHKIFYFGKRFYFELLAAVLFTVRTTTLAKFTFRLGKKINTFTNFSQSEPH